MCSETFIFETYLPLKVKYVLTWRISFNFKEIDKIIYFDYKEILMRILNVINF